MQTPGAVLLGDVLGGVAAPDIGQQLALARVALAHDVAQLVGAPQGFSPSISYGINWVAMTPEREEHAKRLVADAVAQLGERAVGQAVVGMAGEELVQLSREVDMLVVGSRG